MNKKRVHTPEGVRDVYGTEYGQRSKLKAKLNKVFASYGYPQGRCLNSSIEKEIP